MLSQWAVLLSHRTKTPSPRCWLVHAVTATPDGDHVLDILAVQFANEEAAVPRPARRRPRARPRDHAAVDIRPRIEHLLLGLVVDLIDAAVAADPPQAPQRVLGVLQLVVLGSNPDGHRIARGPVRGVDAQGGDGHLIDLDAELLVPVERPDRLMLPARVPLLEIRPVRQGVPGTSRPDVDSGLPAGDRPELAPVALLPGVALARHAAHRGPPDSHPSPQGSGRR